MNVKMGNLLTPTSLKSTANKQAWLSDEERCTLVRTIFQFDTTKINEPKRQLIELDTTMDHNQNNKIKDLKAQNRVSVQYDSNPLLNQIEFNQPHKFDEDMAAMLEFLLLQFEGETLDREAIKFITVTMWEISNKDESQTFLNYYI